MSAEAGGHGSAAGEPAEGKRMALLSLAALGIVYGDIGTSPIYALRETLLATDRPGMAIWRERIFAFISRNAERAARYFHIPLDRVVEIGTQVEL